MERATLEKIFACAGAPAYAAGLVLEEISGAEVSLSGEGVAALVQAAREIRLAGKYPYYTAKAIGCWFAGQDVDSTVVHVISDRGIKAAITEGCGIVYEKELMQDIADAYKQAMNKAPLLRVPEQVALIKRGYERGYYSEKTYRGCAQCTLDALFAVIGHKDETLFRSSDMLASGCGLFGDGPCGGYSGGLLFLGKYAGRRLEYIDGDKEEKTKGRHLAALLHQRFIDCYGTVICHGIHEDIFGRAFDLHDDEQKQGFEAAGAHQKDKCTAVVATATRWVIEILLDEGYITA